MVNRIVPVMAACATVLTAGLFASSARAQTSVTDYHNDTLRTGWNQHETILTVTSVGSGQFGLQHSVPLDEQVDAQPLVVANQTIAGQGVHTVVYVVTENDTVYALDGLTGAVLLSRSLGTPVPQGSLSSCPDNGPKIGIGSTPVISTETGSLYLIADTYENGAPVYRLHALALGTLQDIVPPVVVAAAHPLADGSSFTFDAVHSRQRSALLLLGTSVYAGFASYCDERLTSRGWMLGWSVPSLTPLPNNELTDQLTAAPNNMFLSSIWMSGYGPSAAGAAGPIYFVTGNSDRSGTTYSAVTNLAESLVEISTDLSKVQGVFTPSNESTLDQKDLDFGSGGAMLLPGQTGLTPKLAVAAGKDGRFYLLNRTNPAAGPLVTLRLGACFCGASYFVGADGAGRIVASGGRAITTLVLHNSASHSTTLTQEQQIGITSGQDSGFFTSISSNKTQAGSAVIWAVGRPVDSNPADVMLFAIDPVTGGIVYSLVAGTWSNVGANADIVPTIANGQVYVASNGELAIFGLGNHLQVAERARMEASRMATNKLAGSNLVLQPGEHAIFGRVQAANAAVLSVQKRNGVIVLVDTSAIDRGADVASPVTGSAVLVVGTYSRNGILTARSVHRAKGQAALWLPDR